MLPEEVDVFRMADESFMEEERGSIPRLVHSNDEHSGFELINRNGFQVSHSFEVLRCIRTYRVVWQTEAVNSLVRGRVLRIMLSG